MRQTVVRLAGPTAVDKAVGVVRAFDDVWHGLVLDVGCRSRELEEALAGRPVRYRGLDLGTPADLIANLEEPIPLADGEADVVVALDVLEHVDGIHDAFAELCRVARRDVIVALPNLLVLDSRLRTLRGRTAGKYGLPADPPGDRHRWFFSLEDARAFCRHRAALSGWRIVEEAVVVGPRRRCVEPLVRRWPNLLSPSFVTRLAPATAPAGS